MSDRHFQNTYPDYKGEQNQVGFHGPDGLLPRRFCLANTGIKHQYHTVDSTLFA